MKIYKYSKISLNLLKSLRKKQHWFSNLTYLNDPFDVFVQDETPGKIYEKLRSNLYVCSFSKIMDNILMWSHYGDSHEGICLERDIKDAEISGRMFDIEYDDTLPVLEKVDLKEDGTVHFNIDRDLKFTKFKFTDWSYEEEIRAYMIDEKKQKGIYGDFIGQLSAIYFGMNCSDSNIELIKDSTSEYDKLLFGRVALNSDSNKMNIINDC